MKSLKYSLLFCLAIITLVFARPVSAQQIAYDEADNYVVTANWTNGANAGFGFTPWTILTNGPDFHGTYIQNANVPPFVIATVTNVLGTNYTDVWGLFANGTNGINITTAFRGFTNPLGTNTFKVQWGSRGAGSTATSGGTVHGWCGFSLRTGNTTNNASDFQSGVQLYLYFLDGNSPSTLYYWDGNGVQSVTGTSFSNLGRNNITNAIEAEITPAIDGSTYHMVLKDCVNNSVLFTTDGVLMNPGQAINSAALFCYETTGDQVYNKMQITTSTNIAPTISNVLPADSSLYLTANAVTGSFEVDSFNSTVSASTVSVYLNGVQQSGLNFNTMSPTKQLTASFTPTLAADTFYNYTIMATDAFGNVVSNSYTFNTFLPSDIYVDAYDYNYGAGQFINNNTPVNAYANLLGTNLVDYQIADPSGTNNTAGYRTGDLVETLALPTDTTGDPIDHANLRANSHTAYNIGFTDIGNWEDYTRVYPAANYSIYARAASTGGGQFEVERLATNTVSGTNQPLIALGQVSVPNTGGSLVYSGQLTPVKDFFGNTVVVPFSGTATLRETALTSRAYNLEYFAVVAIPGGGTLRPYISTGSPTPNATGVFLNSSITLSLANRQTSLTTNGLQLILNTTNITSRVTVVSNAVGMTLTWVPTNSLPANNTNTVQLIFTDTSSTSVTNTWKFFTGTQGGVTGSGIWSGLGGSNDMFWADGVNWTGGTPGPGTSASFTSAGATTTPVTNNIVGTNVTILQLNYETNTSGYHTTWIKDGVTLSVTNPTTATGIQAVQVGGAGNGVDNSFAGFVTNTITGLGGTLLVQGNLPGAANVNALNIQVRQNAASCPPRLVTFDLSGLGTLNATVGKFYVAQGGSGANQTNCSGWFLLARTNIIYCLRLGNAGTFEVGDSSGGAFTLPGSALYWGITNTVFADTLRFGKQKATNNLICFNPAFTNGTVPAVVLRNTNGLASYVGQWTIGDADAEATVPDFVQANCDFSGGKLDALVNFMVLARGSTNVNDTGSAQGALTFTAGTLIVNDLTNAVQRANNTTTETGIVNVNGGTLISTNIILAQIAAGGTPALVNGLLAVTNGAVEGNIFAGGGISTVNLNGGTLVVSNAAGTAAARLSALNMVNANLHLKVNGSAPAANVNVTSVTASGTTITIDSVANVSGLTTIHLISYTGSSPFAGLSVSLPPGYSGSLVNNAGSIDLSINTAPTVPPTIGHISIIAGGQVAISGTNNIGAGGTYHLLSSTNLLTPLINWTSLGGGNFDANGNFSITNGSSTNSQQFYILKIP